MVNKTNCRRSFLEKCAKKCYIILPFFIIVLYLGFSSKLNLESKENFNCNLVSVSGTLAGFLFTAAGIFAAFPDNNFIKLMNKYGHMEIINKTLFIGINSLLISLVLGMLDIMSSIKEVAFLIGLTETFISSYYLYRISYLINKNNR